MINCLISDCAGRHTTHVPGGGTAKRFMLFNNKSKTNVAFPPAACLHGASRARAGQWHLARTSIPAGMREQVLDHLPGLFRAGVRIGGRMRAGVGMEEERGKEAAQKCNTGYSGAVCGCSHPGKENTTRSQETRIPARALALPTYVTSLANSASATTSVKWADECFKYHENACCRYCRLFITQYSCDEKPNSESRLSGVESQLYCNTY